ncbi:MAG: hypothetical protein ABS49_03705 [Erythrobacter sp. SCN 62-14]|nr:MAG: hypothetical protein ABS49_03705 [Erythrobacter sp. SCN 62-14]
MLQQPPPLLCKQAEGRLAPPGNEAIKRIFCANAAWTDHYHGAHRNLDEAPNPAIGAASCTAMACAGG